MNAPRVSILIATRDRPQELRVTLASLAEQTWSDLEVLVLDDGSTTHDPKTLESEFPSVKILSRPESRGYIHARNELMREASGDYFVHLDDDANWIRSDALERAIALLEADPEIGAFAFHVHESLQPPDGPGAAGVEPVRSFTGCGHIIRRSAFERFGPLRTEFEFYCEEIDFCLELWRAGLRVVTDHSLVVHHRVDWQLRDRIRESNEGDFDGHLAKDRRVRIGTRNELWWITERAPLILLPILTVNKIVKLAFFHNRRGFLGAVLRGVGDWLRLVPRLARTRDPLSLKTFRQWLDLPA